MGRTVSVVEASAPGESPVSVRFIAPHTHGGVAYIIGDQAAVHPGDADTMRQFGVIESDPAPAPEFIEPITIEPDPDAFDAFDSGGE